MAAFRKLRRRLALDDGLSIIGVAIASLIILVSLIPAASLFTAATVTSVSGQARVIASNIATQVVEADRSLLANDFSAFLYQYWYLPNQNSFMLSSSTLLGKVSPGICTNGGEGTLSSPCQVQTAGLGEPFTVSQTIGWSTTSGTTNSLSIDATVSWGSGTGSGSVDVRTQIAAPSSAYNFSSTTDSTLLKVELPTSPTSFPTSGQVSAFALNTDSNPSSALFLGSMPAQEVIDLPYFFVNNDNYDIAFTWPTDPGGLLCSSTTTCSLASTSLQWS